jgi:hypothetical protein
MRTRRLELLLFVPCVAVLLAAAALLRVEYHDGYDAIANARYLLGTVADYNPNRTPMMSILLLPAEWVAKAVSLPPLSVWPQHLLMALLHIGYLIAVYVMICRVHGRGLATLAAFAATIPSVAFWSYAPFISHDILPGVLLLGMVLGAVRLVSQPSVRLWILLVLLGACAALIKQTFGLFWVGIFLAALLDCELRKQWRVLAMLLAGAVASGALTWLTLGWVLAGAWPETMLLLRPLRQLSHLQQQAVSVPWWLYLGNAPVYGWCAVAAIIPALALARRQGRVLKFAAICWLVGALAMQLLGYKEVRYLLFLAPLSALILVPVFQAAARHRHLLVIGAALLVVDLGRASWEAVRLSDSFFLTGPVHDILEPLRTPQGKRRVPLYMSNQLLSYRDDTRAPFRGDRYHRMYHFSPSHAQRLLGYGPGEIFAIDPKALPQIAMEQAGAALLRTNRLIFNPDPAADHLQVCAVATHHTLVRSSQGWAGDDWTAVVEGDQLVLSSGDAQYLAPSIVLYGRARALVRDGASWRTDLPRAELPDTLQICGFRIHHADSVAQ